MRQSVKMGASDKVNNEGQTSKQSGYGVGRLLNSVMKDPSSTKINPISVPVSTSASEQSSATPSGTFLPYSTSTSKTVAPSTTTTSVFPSSESLKKGSNDKNDASKLGPPVKNAATPVRTIIDAKKSTIQKQATSIVLLGNKPVATFVRSHESKHFEFSTPKRSTITNTAFDGQQSSVLSPQQPQPSETTNRDSVDSGLKTYRIYAPTQKRKSIVVRIGDEEEKQNREKIFEASQIRKETYIQWRKEAKHLLPSASGGAPIEKLTDVLQAAPKLKKEKNPKTLLRHIRRLSNDSKEGNTAAKKFKRKTVKVDYTKHREIKISIDESTADTDSDKSVNSDEEIQRQLEYEQHQAGLDIKEKISTLKQLADHLSSKRAARHQLVELATGSAVLDAEEIPLKEHFLYAIEMVLLVIAIIGTRFDNIIRNSFGIGDVFHDISSQYLIFWEKHITEINGRYGVVVASYFSWLRQIVLMEALMFFICCVLIIIPEFVDRSQEVATYTGASITEFRPNDLITGEGYFHHSYLYYTGYDSRNEYSNNPFQNTAFRFLFCILVKFLLITYFIFSRLTKYYQSVRLETQILKTANMENFKTIMCAWDFSCRDSQAKVYLHKTICREMKKLCRVQQTGTTLVQIEAENKKVLALAIKHFGLFWGVWALHIVGNFLILGACGFLALILVYLCKLKLYYYLECVTFRDDRIPRTLHEPVLCPNGDEYLYTWILSLPALFASVTTLLLTKFILFVSDLESWDTPERKIYATMIRAGFFYFTNIGVFYLFWLLAKPELNKEGFVAETIFGKELYRLVVIQGLIDVTLNLGVKGLYHLLRRKSQNYKMTEFRSEYSCLSMFFLHSVARIGILFCPLISFLITCRLIVDFYQNKFSLIHLSCQENYYTSVSRVYAPFLLTFFLFCYLITFFVNVYYLTDTIPSNYDGPFQLYNVSYDEVLGLLLSAKKISWVSHLVDRGFLFTFLVILGALVFFTREWALAYEPILVKLQEQISLERGDRDLLLKAIFEIGKVTSDDVGDEDHTSVVKVRRAAALARLSIMHMETSEDDIVYDEDDEYKDDQHIDELIQRVRRRRSLATNTEKNVVRQFRAASKADINEVPQSQSNSEVRGSLKMNEKKQHIKNVEAIVAKIVHGRKSRVYDKPPLLDAQAEGHGAMSNFQQQQHPSRP